MVCQFKLIDCVHILPGVNIYRMKFISYIWIDVVVSALIAIDSAFRKRTPRAEANPKRVRHLTNHQLAVLLITVRNACVREREHAFSSTFYYLMCVFCV